MTERPSSNFAIERTSPATGKTIGRILPDSPEAVLAKVELAGDAQAPWGKLSIDDRAARLGDFRSALVGDVDRLIELLALEVGKPVVEAVTNEVLLLTDLITWQCKHAANILAPRSIDLHLLKHRRSFVHYEPRGVIGVISPWNYPLFLPFADVSAAVLAGNGVVVKPSEHAPLIAQRMKELWDESSLPSDLLQLVIGGPEVGAALIDAPISKLAFTGGAEVGRQVAEHCGRNLLECVLELGGKAPLIVCEDANLERAAKAIVWGGFANMGQACVSVERVLAHQEVYDRLIDLVSGEVAGLRQGSPDEGVFDVGAVVLETTLERAERQIRDALDKGARLLTGGHRLNRPGRYFAPTVLADCTNEMAVMREEIFGPVVPIMKISSDSEALAIANSLPFALSSYIFSTNRKRALGLARQLEAGSVVINDVQSDIGSPEVPFGGIKKSGYGRIHGEEGLRSMCHLKHISIDRAPLPKRSPFWFPYTEPTLAQAKRGLRLLYGGKALLGRWL